MSTRGVVCVREAVLDRRALVMEYVGRGLPEWLIAKRLRISHRTVARYKYQERNNIPACPNRKRD